MSFMLSSSAEYDFREIGIYTLKRWGFKQAEQYVLKLEAAFAKIGDNPRIGINCNDIRDGYRRYTVESHHIYFHVVENRVVIIRILHQSRDAENQLQ